jgi:AcrR family transcriptional regulator
MTIAASASSVKRARAYDSDGRREAARRRRDEVVRTARRLFLQHGYAATSVQAIAREAGVSVETVYKTCHGKPGLVRQIHADALRGAGAVAAESRSDLLRVRAADDPHGLVREWGALTAEVMPRVAPILLLVREAAVSDPEVADLHAELERVRLARMSENAAHLHRSGQLRADVSLERCRDVLFAYTSPELYAVLSLGRGWSATDFGRFVGEAIAAAVLPAPRARRRAPRA